ncbi:hypothetical protein MseVgp167 [Melanoplus sanguinipes entomopoxvirus]|uniref:Uncharacterized protein n=1 Tax=Melanoplus sanguinipes entomopoxvirus TaxID=83191 RepID=Q9YVS5_MSEPV|nr:hypothetical protein MseVgp167 [Melanoplus sanguinipes entomopoxvirus]AAC97683.1 ORF MSV167 hypothetical protein [Melanoplus sanguinipes entomopoxvirus 'O']
MNINNPIYINLIDILRTRTFVLDQYERNQPIVYYDYDSYTKVNYKCEYEKNHIKLITEYNDSIIEYNLMNNVRHIDTSQNNIIISNQKSKHNEFDMNILSYHHPTYMKQNRMKVEFIPNVNDILTNYKPSIDSLCIDYKILYNSEIFKEYSDRLYIAYTSVNMSNVYETDYRKILYTA